MGTCLAYCSLVTLEKETIMAGSTLDPDNFPAEKRRKTPKP
jgi:hypothetical protein